MDLMMLLIVVDIVNIYDEVVLVDILCCYGEEWFVWCIVVGIVC